MQIGYMFKRKTICRVIKKNNKIKRGDWVGSFTQRNVCWSPIELKGKQSWLVDALCHLTSNFPLSSQSISSRSDCPLGSRRQRSTTNPSMTLYKQQSWSGII